LINRPGDKAAPLPQLLEQSLRRKRALLDAWAARDLRAVTEIVEESGVAARILGSIAARADRLEIEQRLERLLDDPGIREIMYVYYIRTLSLTLAKNNGVHRARGMRNIGSLSTIS
jgi:hypothetical protein